MNKTVNLEAFRLLCGDLIGKGAFRHVYENIFDPTTVIKVDTTKGYPQSNIFEFDAWCQLKDTPAGAMLAPVELMSPGGWIIVQKKTSTLPRDQYPERIPKFFSDTRYSNFGLLDGKFVCHDYAFNKLIQYTGSVRKTQLVKWWD